jgi:UDP-2,4-diacetamido-2,4,6-trideoxy-beta-L-altropyranose hydrolase
MTWPERHLARDRVVLRANRRILFRCDASSELGLGHLIRCHALADELAQRGLEPWFAARLRDCNGIDGLRAHDHHLIEMSEPTSDEPPAIAALLASQDKRRRRQFNAVVLDHYDLGAQWLLQARKLAPKLIVVDDLANRVLPCDVVINGNLGARTEQYDGLAPRNALLLLGSRYSLLHASMTAAHDVAASRTHGEIRNVLVTLGGTEQSRALRAILEALQVALPNAAVDLVLGSPDKAAAQLRHDGLRIHFALRGHEMARLMLDADLAIGGGGMTALERCSLGLPSIAIRVASNQDTVVDALAAAGAVVDGGSTASLAAQNLVEPIRALARDEGRRSEMGRRGWELVDGRGAIRVAHHIDGVRIRRARLGDAHRLWTWRNDPFTRAMSSDTDSIAFDDHVRWLRLTLADPMRMLLIGWNGAGELGQVRFDRRAAQAEVSISVAPEHRGTVGGLLLRAGISHFRRTWPDLPILAQIKAENDASRGMFERARFELVGEIRGILRYRLLGHIPH